MFRYLFYTLPFFIIFYSTFISDLVLQAKFFLLFFSVLCLPLSFSNKNFISLLEIIYLKIIKKKKLSFNFIPVCFFYFILTLGFTTIEITFHIFPSILGYDIRHQIDVYNDLIVKTKKVSLAVVPQHIMDKNNKKLFSLSGVSNSHTINCNENKYWSIINSDKYGFNNKNIAWEKNKDVSIFLGDSFTYGSCVNIENTIGALYGKYSQSEIVNLSIAGSGPLVQFAILREYLDLIKRKKNVFWVFFEGNDMQDFIIYSRNPILRKYLKDKNFSQKLSNKQNLIDEFLIKRIINQKSKIDKSRKLPSWFFLRTRVALKNIANNIQVNFPNINSTLDFINEFPTSISVGDNKLGLKNLYNKAGGYLSERDIEKFFVFIPDQSRYTKTPPLNKSYAKNTVDKEKLFKIVNDAGFKIIDIDQLSFQNNWAESYSTKGISSHLNENGYGLVAKAINETIN